jgi:hypothetical protein
MFSPTLALAAALTLLAAPGIEPGTQLTYAGTMSGVKDDGDPSIKEFTLTLLAIGGEADPADLAWTLDESGRGGFAWLDRFGRWRTSADGREPGESGPALLYERAAGKSIVPIVPLLFSSPMLGKGASWTEDRLEYRVSALETRSVSEGNIEARSVSEGNNRRPCWQIEVRSPYGRKRTLWVDQGSPLVLKLSETVFIGQGEEHRLELELTETKTLSLADTAQTAAALAAWQGLVKDLAWQPRASRDELSAEQIARLKSALPKLAKDAALGPFAAIAAAAQRDAAGQRNRAGAVAALKEAIVGQPLGELKLTDTAGKPVTADELKGKVVVLHFWPYRDTPLEEPYGQVGYLDFLQRRRGEADLRVIGVAVSDAAGEEFNPRAVAASARKLKSFMNLSYQVAVDNGSLLKRLGDPRVADSKLPLFVVVDRDGKVADYHAGLYEVKANEGLAELDALIEKLLK